MGSLLFADKGATNYSLWRMHRPLRCFFVTSTTETVPLSRRANITRQGNFGANPVTSFVTDNALRPDLFTQNLHGTANGFDNDFDYNPAS